MIPLSLTPPPRALQALLLGAFCLRAVFAFVTPAWQSPDEYPHYWVASSIALGNGYPAGSPEFPRYEAYQSPVYYGLLAGVMVLTGLPGEGYSEEVRSPSLPLVLLRLISALLGSAVVAVTWSVVRELVPGDDRAAYIASAFTAVLPTFVGVSSSLNNDVPAIFLCALFLRVVLRPYSRWTPWSCLAAGFLLGAAIATKLTAVLLLPVLAYRLPAARTEFRDGFWRRAFLFVPGIVAGSAVLAVRNVLVYGDPFVFTPGVQRGFAVTGPQLFQALRNMGWSFWLAFGRTYEIHLSSIVYVLAGGLLAAAALFGWWRERRSEEVRSKAWLIATAAGLGAVFSLAFTLSYPAGTQTSWGKNLYPLLPLFAAFAAFGWTSVFPRHPRFVPWFAISILLAGCVWGFRQLAG